MPNCRSCNAEVIFVPSAKTGRLMCLNADPRPNGNVVIRQGKAHVLSGDLFAPTDGPSNEPRYLSHHADCPNAKAHRKKK